MQPANEFDARARTWDDDPDKTARAQAVATGIRREVPLFPALRALEYGCGTGLLSFALRADFTGHKGFDRDELGRQARAAGFARVQFTAVFNMTKGGGPGQTEFPLFLMVAEKK